MTIVYILTREPNHENARYGDEMFIGWYLSSKNTRFFIFAISVVICIHHTLILHVSASKIRQLLAIFKNID